MKTTQTFQLLLASTGLLPLWACYSPQQDTPTPLDNTRMFTEAENYERFMGRWSRRIAPQLIEFAGVEDGDRVLDVGAGTGALAFELLKNPSLVGVNGIDPSSNYIEHAAAQNDDPRATFEVGDAQSMRFTDEEFDRCLSLFVVNFIPDPAKAVGEMRRVTRSGGVVAAAVWDYAEGMEMLRVFWDEVVALDPSADPRDERHMPFCGKDELIRLWEEVDLKDVEAVALTIDQRFESFDEYWAPFLLGTGPAGAYVASLDPDRKAALRDRLRRRLLAGGLDQAFVLRCRAWAVRGRVL